MSEFWRKCRLFLAKFFDYEWGGKSDNDIRWTVEFLDYAFEGGKFSPNPNAYPNCQGVVVWINPDSSAPVGDRVYVLLPEQMRLQYSTEYCYTGVTDIYDGRANTRNLVEYGKKHNIEFPAAEYAYNYCKNGIKQGDAFLLAKEQLEIVIEELVFTDVAFYLNKIGGDFDHNVWLVSSTEVGTYDVYSINSSNGYHDDDGKKIYYAVSCFIAY